MLAWPPSDHQEPVSEHLPLSDRSPCIAPDRASRHDAARMIPRPILVVLLVVNAVVLLGQIWPEGAPPFARTVNIAFLIASLLVFAALIRNSKGRTPGI